MFYIFFSELFSRYDCIAKQWRSEMLVSVIVPIYYGKQYIVPIMRMLERNLQGVGGGKAELILVNDSPEDTLSDTDIPQESSFSVYLLTNPQNCGIHYSRVQGLLKASGEWILFLDQDDKIDDGYLESQCIKLHKKTDVIVANGTAEYNDYTKVLYRYAFMQWTVKWLWTYALFDCRILSPGQCIIRKDSIPAEWKMYILENSGSDDYYLWLLMLTERKHFQINRDKLYTHVYTGVNASNNMAKMRCSVEEILSRSDVIEDKTKNVIRKRLSNHKKSFLVWIIETINTNKD